MDFVCVFELWSNLDVSMVRADIFFEACDIFVDCFLLLGGALLGVSTSAEMVWFGRPRQPAYEQLL